MGNWNKPQCLEQYLHIGDAQKSVDNENEW
jgi:hypothetical protein